MSAPQLSKRLLKISESWPTDPFRPHLQLKTFFASLARHPRLSHKAIASAEALEKDEFKSKYPLSQRLAKPASMPLYYDRLVEGFEKSAQGIKRPWWKIFFGVW